MIVSKKDVFFFFLERITKKQSVRARIHYKNWKGLVTWRKILADRMVYESTEWHPEKQWLLEALDIGKQERRSFALKDILEAHPIDEEIPNEGITVTLHYEVEDFPQCEAFLDFLCDLEESIVKRGGVLSSKVGFDVHALCERWRIHCGSENR